MNEENKIILYQDDNEITRVSDNKNERRKQNNPISGR